MTYLLIMYDTLITITWVRFLYNIDLKKKPGEIIFLTELAHSWYDYWSPGPRLPDLCTRTQVSKALLSTEPNRKPEAISGKSLYRSVRLMWKWSLRPHYTTASLKSSGAEIHAEARGQHLHHQHLHRHHDPALPLHPVTSIISQTIGIKPALLSPFPSYQSEQMSLNPVTSHLS